MIEVICAPTKSSPTVSFDQEDNIFKVEGISTLVNAFEFFDLAKGWIDLHEQRMQQPVDFQFHLPYFNSASMKGILQLMQRIKQGVDDGKNWSISWNVEDDDEFLLDAAESFQEMINMEIRIMRS
jgi:SiaC family regulatory phosphoprotein